MRTVFCAVLLVGLALLSDSARSSTVELYVVGGSTPLDSIDFGKVKVGETAEIPLEIVLNWDGFPATGDGGLIASKLPFGAYSYCIDGDRIGFLCLGGSAFFTPTKPGKAKGTLSAVFEALLTNCSGRGSYLDEEGVERCVADDSVAYYDEDRISLEIPISGIGSPAPVPVPAALPLLASGIGALGFAGWRRSKNRRSDLAK